jgi:hypothetical protein
VCHLLSALVSKLTLHDAAPYIQSGSTLVQMHDHLAEMVLSYANPSQ